MSSVGAACKVSPNWLQETVTCHSSHCFSIVWGQGNTPLVACLPSRKLKEIVCSLMNCIYRHLKLSVASSLSFLEY